MEKIQCAGGRAVVAPFSEMVKTRHGGLLQ